MSAPKKPICAKSCKIVDFALLVCIVQLAKKKRQRFNRFQRFLVPAYYWKTVEMTANYFGSGNKYKKYCDLQNNCKFDRPLRNDFGPLFLIPTTQLYKTRTLDGDSTHPGVFLTGGQNCNYFASRSMVFPFVGILGSQFSGTQPGY